jgi:hypothetical protein
MELITTNDWKNGRFSSKVDPFDDGVGNGVGIRHWPAVFLAEWGVWTGW